MRVNTKQHLRDFLMGVPGFVRRNRKRLIGALCFAVAFGTIAALSLPAVTLDDTVYCGQEEHVHTEECYKRVLVCGYEEGEADGHVHSESCYQTETVLICGMEEGEGTGHTHSESCFEARTTLICGQEATGTEGGHVHTDRCYETQLVCGKTAHTHSLACQSNPEADTETADDWKKALSAAKLTGVWAEDLLSVAKTQLGYTESTKNYQVQDDGVTLSGYTRYGAWNGTPYADWNATFVSFCLNYAEISAEELPVSTACESWVALLSGEQAGFEDCDLFRAAGTYTPEPGDLIFFDTDADGKADRVGIVTAYTEAADATAAELSGVSSGVTPEAPSEEASDASSGVTPEESEETEQTAQVKTIEGDLENRVAEAAYDADDATILGYAALPENPEPEEPDASEGSAGSVSPESEPASEPDAQAEPAERTLRADAGDGVTFTATGTLPEGTRLVVTKLTDEQVAYIGEHFADVTLGAANYAYDVKLCDADGVTFEPDESVHISISGLDVAADTEFKGYHLADVSAENLTSVDAEGVVVEAVEVTADEGGLAYDASGFSIMLLSSEEPSPRDVDQAIIQDLSVTFVSGATETDYDGKTLWVWNPTDTAAGHSFVYQVNYTVSGVDKLAPKQLQIKLPLHILKDKDGNWADTFDCPYMSEDEVGEGDNPEFVYKIVQPEDDPEGEGYVLIYNYSETTAGSAGYVQFSYTTTESTLEYEDMVQSTTVDATLTVTDGETSESKTADPAHGVAIDTHATISSTNKKTPTYYESWEDSWGTKPGDADEYYYLVYPITTYINKNTSKYNFTLTDSFSSLGGSVVAFRFGSNGDWTAATQNSDGTASATLDAQTGYGYRYDYVLVRYSKADAAAALAEGGNSYTITNSVTATVDPVDQVDPDTTASSSRSWTYTQATYTAPAGRFDAGKNGLYGAKKTVKNTSHISSYLLAQYLSGTANSVTGLQYYAYTAGYPYPWTAEGDLAGTADDAEKYGKKAVTFALSDETFAVQAVNYNENYDAENEDNTSGVTVSGTQVQLYVDDYDLTALQWNVSSRTATYDTTEQAFVASSISSYSSDLTGAVAEDPYTVNTVYLYAKKANDADWVLAAVYDLESGKYTSINGDYLSSASEKTITFQSGVKGYKIVTSNAYYYTLIEAYPTVTLYRTDHVAQILTGKADAKADDLKDLEADEDGGAILSLISLKNTATGSATQSDEAIFSRDVSGTDYIRAVERESSLTKNVIATQNDKPAKEYTVTWQSVLAETYVTDDGVQYVAQESGVFYDLLPSGAVLDVGSIVVRSGVTPTTSSTSNSSGTELASGEYTYEVIENYEGTGRQMLVVTIAERTEKGYSLTYDTVHSWNAIQDYGRNLENYVAYETGNDDLASGEPDQGIGGVSGSKLTEDAADDATGTQKFRYADATYEINALIAANTGLIKQVRAEGDSEYSYSTTVLNGGTYSYQLRYANESDAISDHIILMDSIEHFIQASTEVGKEAEESDWYGTLTGIDTSQLTAMGISPVIYVSTTEGVNFNTLYDAETGTIDLTGNDWSVLTADTDLSTVHAVAIDCTKNVDGIDFRLKAGESLTVTLYMQAPEDGSATADQYAYNNVYVLRTVYNASGEGEAKGSTDLYHQDYTQVSYLVAGDVLLTKVNAEDPSETIKGVTYLLRGTSDYGTAVEETAVSNSLGEISFRNIEMGTYELVETKCGSDWQLSNEVYTVKITASGVTITGSTTLTQSNGRYLITDEPRVHGDLTLQKLDSVYAAEKVSGAQFRLSGTSYYNNDVLLFATTGEDGSLTFSDVERGTYQLVEVSVEGDYIVRSTAWTVIVDGDGNVTLYTTDDSGKLTAVPTGTSEATPKADDYYDLTENKYVLKDEPLHTVQFVKTSTYGTNNYISGVVFSLTGTSDYGTAVDQTATSNSEGIVEFSGLEPGAYTLQETDTSNAQDSGSNLTYTADAKRYTVTVRADGTYTISGLGTLNIGTADAPVELYNFPNTPDSGVVKVTKIWLGAAADIAKLLPGDLTVTLSTSEPSYDQLGAKTVTFDANGGSFGTESNTINTVSYTSSGKLLTGSSYLTPTKSGATFSGWYTAASGGTKVEVDEDGYPSGYDWGANTAVTLYAHWNRMSYAVQLYALSGGDGVDDDGNKTTLGLTFGPAIGGNYVNSSVGHTVDTSGAITGDAAGTTSAGNAYRCIHNDSWSTIIAWNKKDPEVYAKCLKSANGCTKSVELSTNTTTTILNTGFTGTYTGDGPGLLLYELLNMNNLTYALQCENLRFSSYSASAAASNYTSWKTSRIRAMLNGANDDTDKTTIGDSSVANAASIYTAENCLLATLPTELQNAIGTRTIESYTYDGTTGKVETTNDKLWLMAYGSNNGDTDVWTAAGETSNTNRQSYFVNGKTGGSTAGNTDWWLRSQVNGSVNIRTVASGGGTNYKPTSAAIGVAFGFSLAKN